MPYKGIRSHLGQRKGSARKRKNRQNALTALKAEAEKLGISTLKLLGQKIQTGLQAKRKIAEAQLREMARMRQEGEIHHSSWRRSYR